MGIEKMMRARGRRIEVDDPYHRPIYCDKCSGVMVFKGVGEYHCEDCGYKDYDDYGLTRLYIEKHPGATSAEVEMNTGVTQRTIRHMLKENRLEIAGDNNSFLTCEGCGKSIKSGRYCADCEKKLHEIMEEEARKNRSDSKKVHGFGSNAKSDDGAKRFSRH